LGANPKYPSGDDTGEHGYCWCVLLVVALVGDREDLLQDRRYLVGDASTPLLLTLLLFSKEEREDVNSAAMVSLRRKKSNGILEERSNE
jgi:hypothetical protein